MKTITNNLLSICVFLFGIWALTPALREIVPRTIIALVAVITLLLMLFKRKGKIDQTTALVFLWLIIEILYKVVGISDDTWANHSNRFMFYFCMILSLYFINYTGKKTAIKISRLLFLVILINLAYQYYLYITTGSSLYSVKTLLTEGIVAGSTNFVAVIMIVTMCVFMISYVNPNPKNLIISIIVILAGFYYIINIQTRATAFIILAFYIIFLLLFRANNRIGISKVIVAILAIVLIAVVFPFFVNWGATWDNEYFARKFLGIQGVLTSGIDLDSMGESSLTTRIYIAGVSIKTWLSNAIYFLIGKGYDAGFYNVSGIGKHSEIIDSLPKYGVIGCGIMIIIFTKYIKNIKLAFSEKLAKAYLHIIILFLIYSVLNNSFYPDIGCALCLVIPGLLMGAETNDSKSKISLRGK